jgi:hypothetical protein
MTPEQIAWLAGLFDGEGSINTQAHLNKTVNGLSIQITNTCHELLVKVQEVTGVGFIATRPPHKNPQHKTTYDWRTSGAVARDIVTLIHPWLIVKRATADLVVINQEGI